jgi:hypothetical protein
MIFGWLFGPTRTEADALRDEVAFLRGQVERQRVFYEERLRTLGADNTKLRMEIISLCNAGAAAQIQAYRERARMPVVPQPKPEPSTPGSDMRNLQDYAADGVLPDEDLVIEEAAHNREMERLRAARGETMPQFDDEPLDEAVPA